MKSLLHGLLLLLLTAPPGVKAFNYYFAEVQEDVAMTLNDAQTGILDIKTLFNGQYANVIVSGVAWERNETNSTNGGDQAVTWETLVDGKVQDSGEYSLVGVGRELPDTFATGSVKVDNRGTYTITVRLTVDQSEVVVEGSYQAYAPGVAIIPLLVVLCFAAATQMVELSLFTAIFVGSCMVAGNINDGFKELLDIYILEAVADVDHGYVYLFTLFLSGLVGMMEKSGGMMGFTNDVSMFARTARTGQFACYGIGMFVFFDDYANVLLAGETMRPLLDLLFVSREKLAFIVDATAAPIASISPISSWVGYEVGLIQTEIDRIIELNGGDDDIGIKTSGLGVFFQSIKYRYYPIFMIVFIFVLIYAQRDFGPMLVAERKTEVFQRTDGGDGKGLAGSSGDGQQNKPREDTPAKSLNMFFPVVLLIFFIFWLLVQTGTIPGTNQTFMDKIENSNSYQALLWGTMGTALCTMFFYLLQIVKDGEVVVPRLPILKELFSFRNRDEDAEPGPRVIMSVKESVESFLFGMGRIFPALIVLTLAWASGAVMVAVGADRLFSAWIVGGVAPESLPTLSFVISFLMALATGTSWGTMAILFPLILVPTYVASGGDATIFYATTAGVLSGSVAGDHVSPISDTTVLSSLACDCKLMNHVGTQAPYVLVCFTLSIILGTLPIGYEAWPNMVGYAIGWVLSVIWIYTVCVPVLSPIGRYDIFTKTRLKVSEWRGKESQLHELKEDTIRILAERAAAEEESPKEGKELDNDDTSFDVGDKEYGVVQQEDEVDVGTGDIVEEAAADDLREEEEADDARA